MDTTRGSALNDSQQRRLIVTCQYVDRLLADLEHAFIEAQSNSPFGRYANDLAPAEQRLVRDYIARLRTQLLRMLDGQGLSATPIRIALRHSLLTHLSYIDIAVEELKPHYMQGFGAVAPEAGSALNGIVEELHGTIGQLTRALSAERSADLKGRLERIGPHPDFTLLDTLEEIVTRYGLVEFRTALTTVLDTLERRGLELAVFGRVSTGKSSLLNRLLDRDVLPVGVTPITAVPTRIGFGRRPRLRVSFADVPARELDVDALAEYASERQNPANAKRVMRLVVELPAPFLESGVTLVDTPGLGSLATAGATETLAYLPHCDVAAVLVDAASTVMAEDLTTIGLLVNAGIRVSVLVSKADLLADSDLASIVAYTRDMLLREFKIPVSVLPVSIKPDHARLFDDWRENELAPLIADQERERRMTAARKMEVLRAQVESRLQQLARAGERDGATTPRRVDDRTTDVALQTAAGRITELERRIDELTLTLPKRTADVVSKAADLIVNKHEPRRAVGQAFREVTGDAAREVGRDLQDLATSLAEVNRQTTAALDIDAPGAPDSLRHAATVREVPIPDLPPAIDVPHEGAERILGRGVARSVIARRLQRTVGATLESTLNDYAAVLRRWALNALDDIRVEWTATTDSVRAAIDGRLGHGAAASVSDLQSIARDLERISLPVLR